MSLSHCITLWCFLFGSGSQTRLWVNDDERGVTLMRIYVIMMTVARGGSDEEEKGWGRVINYRNDTNSFSIIIRNVVVCVVDGIYRCCL